MIFEPRKIYTHERMMDVDVVVLDVVQVRPEGTKLNVYWISKKSRRFIMEEQIFVKSEQYPNWKEVPE